MIDIQLPRSKSLVIRYLILNYLYYNQIVDIQDDDAEDVKIVHHALKNVQNRIKQDSEPTLIDIKDCGAGYRFLMAMLTVVDGKWFLTGTDRVLQRPIDPLVYALRRIGADIEQIENGWLINGKSELCAYSMVIDCTQSSQFASALWLISQKLGSPAIQTTPANFASESYLEITKQVWGNFFLDGVPSQIEGDWSAAIYWYAYALLNPGKQITFKNLQYPSVQNDAKIVEWFALWGVETKSNIDKIEIFCQKKQELKPRIISLKNNLDLAPVLAVLAVLFPFELTLTDIDNLDFKESKRGTLLVKTLEQFTEIKSMKHPETDRISSITILKRTTPLPNFIAFDSFNDHRMVMSFHLFSYFSNITIQNSEVVNKSYPSFYSQIQSSQ